MRIVPRDTVVGFLLGIFLVVLAPPPAALAHDPFVWFDPIGWDNHQDINYKIDDSIPGDNGSNFEKRSRRGDCGGVPPPANDRGAPRSRKGRRNYVV
jgi:hypothetical protein